MQGKYCNILSIKICLILLQFFCENDALPTLNNILLKSQNDIRK